MSDLRETNYGFIWGPIEIKRLYSDPKFGYGLQVKIGGRIFEFESSPAGRKVHFEEVLFREEPEDAGR